MCEYGSVYMPCGPACEQTCHNIGDDPEPYCENMHCVEGCFCPPGMVKEGTVIAYLHIVIISSIDIICYEFISNTQ